MSTKDFLKEIAQRVEALEARVDVLFIVLRKQIPAKLYLELPDHLRKTVSAMQQLGGRACAVELAAITGRARAVESGYLNQLFVMKYVMKPPRHHRIQYYVLI